MNSEASGPKHSIGLFGCLVSGVSIPMNLIVSDLLPKITLIVSPSTILDTSADSTLLAGDGRRRVVLLESVSVSANLVVGV